MLYKQNIKGIIVRNQQKLFMAFLGCLIIGLILGSADLIFRYLKLDKTPPHWDYANHVLHTIDYLTLLEKHKFWEVMTIWRFYPPLTYIFYAFVIKFFGYSPSSVTSFNLIIIILSAIVIYYYTRILSSPKVALFVTYIGLIIMTQSQIPFLGIWDLMLDFPLMLSVLGNYLLYIYLIRNKKLTFINGFCLGILFGLSMLIKWSAVFYLIPPLTIYSYLIIKNRHFNAILGFGVSAFLVAGPWYITNWSHLTEIWSYFGLSDGIKRGDPQGFLGIIYYVDKTFHLIIKYLWVFCLPLIYGLVSYSPGKNKSFFKCFICDTPEKIISLTEVSIVVCVIFVFGIIISDKDVRYLLPLYIFSAIILSRRIAKISSDFQLFFYVIIISAMVILNFPFAKKYDILYSPLLSLESMIQHYKPRIIGYFFEQNTRDFNSANVIMLHRIKKYNNLTFADYHLMNDLMENTKIWICDISLEPDMIAVYDSKNGIIKDPGNALRFQNLCPVEFRDKYIFIHQENFSDGSTLLYYTHI